jgi:putative membrane protein
MTPAGWAVVGFLALWPAIATAQDRYDWGWGMHHPMWGPWGLWGIAMMLMMLVFWGAVIAAIVLGIRWLTGLGRAGRPHDAALDILRQRYARGEIDKEEFEAKRRDLT